MRRSIDATHDVDEPGCSDVSMQAGGIDTGGMIAAPTTASPTLATRQPLIGILRVLLLTEAALGVALAILLSMLASGMENVLGGPAVASAETPLRFAAGGTFLFAIFAMVASRGARRRRGWAWTLGALLQVVLAIGTGIAVMSATWHPAYLAGFGLAAVVMTVLSTGSVRRALGQE
jgi:hypothetical protein